MTTAKAIPSHSSLGSPLDRTPVWTPERSAVGGHNPWLVTVIIACPVFLEVLDTTIANVALRSIAGSLGAGVDESTWVITSYLVANAVILPISGWLSEVIGRKQFFGLCMALFTLASFLCGTATSMPLLIFYRVVQGLAGGGMIPISQAMIADSFPPQKRGAAFAIWGMAAVVAPVIGPPLGGWITDSYSWPWIFYMKVPLGLASTILCWLYLVEPPLLVQKRRCHWAEGLRVDYIGFVLAAVGLAFLAITLSKGEQQDWFASHMIRTTAGVSGLALFLMVLWERRRRDPVVDVGLFLYKSFAASFLVMFAAGMVLYSSNVLMPALLQSLHGYTALTAGLAMLPAGLAAAVGMVAVGVLTKRVQLRYLVAIGLISQILPYWHMSGFATDLTFWHVAWAMVPQFLGLGCLAIPLLSLCYDGLSPTQTNGASTLITISRFIGGSFGISLVTTWLSWRTQYHHSILAEHISPYDPSVMDTLAGVQAALPPSGAADPSADPQTALALDGLVNRQAGVMAYNDVFILMLLVCLTVLPLVFFLPRNKPGQGNVAIH